MSGPDIWMPLYVGDYLRDTMHLTTEQHGAYLLLIIVCWTRGGSLPGDDRQLAKITGLSLKAWRAQKEVLGRFFTQADGCWKHGRVTRELERTASLRESRTRAAREGAKSRFATIDPQKSASFPELGGSKTIANPIANGQQNDSYSPSPSPSPIEEPPSLRSGGSAREARDPPAAEPDASRNPSKASKRRRPKPRQRFPDNWLPDPQDAAFAHQRGHDDAWIATNALHCRAHHVAKGTLTTDPAATWRTWVLQAPQFERNSTNGGANGHTGPATAHARAAATVLAEREARLGADRPADRALLAPKRGPGDA